MAFAAVPLVAVALAGVYGIFDLRPLRGQRRARRVLAPRRAHLAQPRDDRRVEQPLPVGRTVEQEVRPARLQHAQVLVDDGGDAHQAADVGRPEPVVAAAGVDLLSPGCRRRCCSRARSCPRGSSKFMMSTSHGSFRWVWSVSRQFGLQRLHQRADLFVGDRLVAHLPRVAVDDQDRNRAVVGQQLGDLRRDVVHLRGRDRAVADPFGVVPDRVVETGREALGAERVDVGAHDVALPVHPRDVADVEVADAARPQREAVVVARGQHAVGHVRATAPRRPLRRVEAGRVEHVDRQVRLRPRSRVRQDAEVDEHAEAQIDVVALQRLERARRRRPAAAAARRRRRAPPVPEPPPRPAAPPVRRAAAAARPRRRPRRRRCPSRRRAAAAPPVPALPALPPVPALPPATPPTPVVPPLPVVPAALPRRRAARARAAAACAAAPAARRRRRAGRPAASRRPSPAAPGPPPVPPVVPFRRRRSRPRSAARARAKPTCAGATCPESIKTDALVKSS